MAREGWQQAVGARPISLLSRGSKNHHRGQCNPCRNFFTEAGCKDGQRCNFCHMPHTQEWLSHASFLRERHQAEVKSKQRREGGGQRQSYRSDRGRSSATSSYAEGVPAPFFEPPPVPYPSSWGQAPFWPEPGYQSMAASSQIIHVPQVPQCASRFETPSQGQSNQGGNVQRPQPWVSSAQQWISGDAFPGNLGGRDGSTNAVPQEVGAVQCPARDSQSIPDPAAQAQAMPEESQNTGFVVHGGPYFI